MLKHTAKSIPALALITGLLFPSVASAKFVFPTNHPDLEWYTIETEHFAVHYPKSKVQEGNEHYLDTAVSAALVARTSEEMWPQMCEHFNYYLKERVHITVLNQSDDLEGFTIPTWDWIEISTNPGSYFYRQRGRMEWFYDVLAHEFGHVVSLKMNHTLAEGAYGVLIGGLYQDGINDVDTGAEFFITDSDPFMWSEGIAEGSSELVQGNWWTAARDQGIRTTFLEDEGARILDYDGVQNRGGNWDWNDGERAYQQGYSFNIYLRQRFGDDVYSKFAYEGGKTWRADWMDVMEMVTGVEAPVLYQDYLDYLKDKYTAQYDAIKAEGEVVGRELLSSPVEWDYTTPSGREAWLDKTKREKIDAKQATGTWVTAPRVDRKLNIYGIHNRGAFMFEDFPIDREEAFTGHYRQNATAAELSTRHTGMVYGDFMHSWDFIPGEGKIVFTGLEKSGPKSKFKSLMAMNPNLKGYNWNQLWIYTITERDEKDNGIEYKTWADDNFASAKKYAEGQLVPIPNTLRGTSPTVSPDGKKVAYLQYHDGTHNLVTINIDGTEKTYLTNFNDGTWMQNPAWSPDGKKIVFAMFKNYRQNLFIVDADGSNLTALTWDGHEEEDASWSADSKTIYFAAEPKGVYNIFAYNIEEKRVKQLTNVVGGAMTPIETPEGNLIFTYFTAYGYKTYGLHKADFLNKDVTEWFSVNPDPAEVAANVAFSEDFSKWEAMTRPYKINKSYVAPAVIPIFRLENDSRTNVGIQGGFQASMQDAVEKHSAFMVAQIGEDLLVYGVYNNSMWYPNLYVLGYHYEVKYDYGYQIDEDDNPDTTDDIEVYESKNQQYGNILMAFAELPWDSRWSTQLYGRAMEYGFRTTSENQFTPYQWGWNAGALINFSNISSYYAYDPNPPAGRNIEIDLGHGFTDIVYKAYGGVSPDDGQLMDYYHYNQVEIRWTEMLNVPSLGGLGLAAKAREKDHRIQLDARVGFIDRNVNYNDEFRAGGQHPYFWGNNSMRPNTQFAGYPSQALQGETMGILNLAYRFPIKQEIGRQVGPFYFTSAWMQVMGGAGNLWSYRPPEDPDLYWRDGYDERIAKNVDDIEREVPFVDKAYKNDNYMLYDAGVEFRVSSILFNGPSWDSFLRVAYGFNSVRGMGDVDGDDIYDTSDSAFGDELSNEVHPAGFRVYIGLGTGW